jgi:hypothetical protein
MATRFSVSLAHAGCDHTGSVVWEERGRGSVPGEGGPVVVSLPRGFVSLNAEDGSIEIVCAGCRHTVAAAARGHASGAGAPTDRDMGTTAAEPPSAAIESPGGPDEAPNSPESPDATAPDTGTSDTAGAGGHTADTAPAEPIEATTVEATPIEAIADAKVNADIEALFAEADDVAPIRGDAIPQHLLGRLRHLAERLRQRRA